MFRLRFLSLMLTLWIASNSPLSSQRHQRVHASGGSYLAKVSSVAEKKDRVKPTGNTVPFSPVPEDKKERYGPMIPPRAKSAYVAPLPRTQSNNAPILPTSDLDLPIVDIFFIFADMPKMAPFVHSEYFWVLPSVAGMLIKTNKSANAADSEVRIHVISDSVKVIEKASSLGFYSYDLVPHIDKHHRFLNRVGGTVNSSESELGFFRWKVLNHIVSDWNGHAAESPIRRVMMVSSETLLTVNAAALYDRAVIFAQKTAGASTLRTALAPDAIYLTDAVMLYSPRGLNAFDAYIDEWFNSGKRDEVRRKSVGTHNRPWSDVILFEHFANASTPVTLRVKWFDAVTPDASTKQLEVKQIQALGCEPLSYYDNPYGVHVRVNGLPYQLRNKPQLVSQANQDPRVHDVHIYGPEKEYPFCFMGFVHRHAKNMMYVYGRALEILRGGEEAHTPTAVDPLAGDMLLAPEKSREVYYIHSNSSRYFIANKEEFKHMFLARERVIGRVPMGVIEAFYPLPLTYPWQKREIISFGKSQSFYYVDKDDILRPLKSQEEFKRFNQTIADVKTYKDYGGYILDSIPIGPIIGL